MQSFKAARNLLPLLLFGIFCSMFLNKAFAGPEPKPDTSQQAIQALSEFGIEWLGKKKGSLIMKVPGYEYSFGIAGNSVFWKEGDAVFIMGTRNKFSRYRDTFLMIKSVNGQIIVHSVYVTQYHRIYEPEGKFYSHP